MTFRATRRLPFAVAAVAAALALASCTSGGDPQSGGSSAGADDNRVIVVGQTTGVSQLDPNITTLTAERVMWNLLWDGLTTQSPSGQVEGELAEAWQISEDHLTWTFQLREGVTFHDGRPFVADDVEQTLERVLDPDIASPQRSKLSSVEEVVAIDEHTVEFHLSAPFPQLDAALVDVKIIDVSSLDEINVTGNGTGPFVLDSFVPDQELSVLPNADYWGGEPAVSGVRVVKYADGTSARSALESGSVDVLWSVPFDEVESQTAAGSLPIVPANPSQAAVFVIDNSSAPFDDVRARQALSYAVDRETMKLAAFGGLGELNFGSTLVSPVNEYFAPAEVTDYQYDLDRAADLFAQAGVDGSTPLLCWAMSDPQYRAQCEILQQSLAEIGITLDIEVNESSTWAARFYPAGKEYGGLIVPNYLSREPAPLPFVADYFGEGGWSETNWPGTAEYEVAKESIKNATDDAEIAVAFAEFQRITSQEQPLVVVENVAQPSMTAPDIVDVWMEDNGTLHVENARVAG